MIKSKIRSVGFSMMLIIIVAIISIGFVSYYVSQTIGGVNKLSIFKNTVNEMTSLAKNFYGGSWHADENLTGYMILSSDGGRYDVVFMNGTTMTIKEDQEEYHYWKTFFEDIQSNVSPKAAIFIDLSNDNEGEIALIGYYWTSFPNPAQEVYEKARNGTLNIFYGITTGMRGNNIWIYSKSYDYEAYAELGQNVFIMIIADGIDASSDQLQAFASKAENLLNLLAR